MRSVNGLGPTFAMTSRLAKRDPPLSPSIARAPGCASTANNMSKYYDIHERARQISAQKGIAIRDAYRELTRRSIESRRAKKNYGTLHADDSRDFGCISTPTLTVIRLPYADN